MGWYILSVWSNFNHTYLWQPCVYLHPSLELIACINVMCVKLQQPKKHCNLTFVFSYAFHVLYGDISSNQNILNYVNGHNISYCCLNFKSSHPCYIALHEIFTWFVQHWLILLSFKLRLLNYNMWFYVISDCCGDTLWNHASNNPCFLWFFYWCTSTWTWLNDGFYNKYCETEFFTIPFCQKA